MKPFVRDEVLLPKLPVFINSPTPLTEEKLDFLKEMIERDLIFSKALELLTETTPNIASLKKQHPELSSETLLTKALENLARVS